MSLLASFSQGFTRGYRATAPRKAVVVPPIIEAEVVDPQQSVLAPMEGVNLVVRRHKAIPEMPELMAAAPEHADALNAAYMLGYEKGLGDSRHKSKPNPNILYSQIAFKQLVVACQALRDEPTVDNLDYMELTLAAAEGCLNTNAK